MGHQAISETLVFEHETAPTGACTAGSPLVERHTINVSINVKLRMFENNTVDFSH